MAAPYPTKGSYPAPSYPAPVGVVVAEPYSKAWFPGYDASVEENRTRRCWNWVLLVAIGLLAVASIVVGIFVIRPGVVFQRFEHGECTLKKLTFKDYKGCSCGKNCNSKFPCYQLSGVFTSDAFGTGSTDMEFSRSFWDYDKGCAWISCDAKEDKNGENIYNDAVKFYKENGYDYSKLETGMKYPTSGATIDTLDDTIEIDCYGDNKGYSIMEFINSSVWIGCGTIPLILFLISVVLFLRCSTPGMRLSASRWLFLPCFYIKDSQTTKTYMCGPCR